MMYGTVREVSGVGRQFFFVGLFGEDWFVSFLTDEYDVVVTTPPSPPRSGTAAGVTGSANIVGRLTSGEA